MEVETTFTGFADREEGGRRLAKALRSYRNKPDALVLALPRGGVVTAAAVAEELDLPLDVLVVRKLGTPGQEELAMGAIGSGGVRAMNEEVVSALRIAPRQIESAARREMAEIERRQAIYRKGQPPLDLKGKTVIVVDDGLATGATMAAAIAVVRRQDAARIVLAVPVAPIDTLQRFRWLVDEIAYLETPDPFQAVGYWYVGFAQVEDDEVVRTLERMRSRVPV